MAARSISDVSECSHQVQNWQTDAIAEVGPNGKVQSLDFYCYLCDHQVKVVLEYSQYNPQGVDKASPPKIIR